MEDVRENLTTIRAIDMVAQHGYMKIAELIDGNHLDEARQVADLLQVVGIV